ncbi:BT0820 family HAD-type phosphatase [Ancylomarina sp. YFZ004]
MIIAIDFDGTLVEQKYPKVGKEIPFAIETLKMLQAKGHRLILWTYRSGNKLAEAVEFCSSRGVEFYAINKNYPEEIFDDSISRKIKADMYIDDMNYGGLPDWGEIYAGIIGEGSNGGQITRKSGFARLFSKA